jgi:hypothetical protein
MAWKGIDGDQNIFFSSFDGRRKLWTPQQMLPYYTSTSPALAVSTNKRLLYMAWKGMYDDQRIFFTTFNGSGWTPQQVLSDRGTSTSPALAEHDGIVYMAWKGINNDQRIFYSWFDETKKLWTPQQVLSDRGTSTSPALASHLTNATNTLYMAWKGVDWEGSHNDQRIFYSWFDGSRWTPQQVLSDRGTSTSPALANRQGSLYMAWKGVDWEGSHNDQYIFYSVLKPTSRTSTFPGDWAWTPQHVLSDRGTSTSPALANYVLPS